MADAATQDKVPSEAEQRAANKAKLAKMEKAEQAEKDAATLATAPRTMQPTAPRKEGFRQAEPRDRALYGEVEHAVHIVKCRGVTPEHAQDPRYLWQIQHKLARYDEVILADIAFRWEVRVRVMYKDPELQLVRTSPIAPVAYHEVGRGAGADLDQLKVEHKGSVDKWTVFLGAVKLKTGFETQEEAEDWVRIRKMAA
jgi:hypothetical protein